ncbi:MAG: hypothetical protein U5L72_12820 [Bacteroidales bacterium]|nr:hypothetical protein [Bacteroidales bacterium]
MNHVNLIRELAQAGKHCHCAGGRRCTGFILMKRTIGIRPSEAVIDKDLASALLGSVIGADEFYILTDVPYVYINYKKPDQEIKEFLDYKDTMKYLSEGQFTKGSMAPKIEACLNFIRAGGSKSVITEAFKLEDRRYGTKITMEYD